jgi:hypothetical protein
VKHGLPVLWLVTSQKRVARRTCRHPVGVVRELNCRAEECMCSVRCRAVVLNLGYVYPRGYANTSYGLRTIENKKLLRDKNLISDADCKIRITWIMHQQLRGHNVEDKLHVGGKRTVRGKRHWCREYKNISPPANARLNPRLYMPSVTLHRVGHVRSDDSEKVPPPSSGFFRLIGSHICVTVESLFISLGMETIPSPKRRFQRETHVITSQELSIIDAALKASQKTSVLRPYIVSLYGGTDQQWFHCNTTVESYHPEASWKWMLYVLWNVGSN